MILWGLLISITSFPAGASVFKLVDRLGNDLEGEELGLLLYNGGTVCDDFFNDIAADAICKEMNYGSAIRWTIYLNFGYYQRSRDINLDDVECNTPEWESCTYSSYHDNCDHDEDVFLSCRGEKKMFTLVNKNGYNIEGEDLGLLLYNGGTVCDDYFNDIAADAICKEMNYERAIKWTVHEDYGNLQMNYDIKLDNVVCTYEEWESCSFTEKDIMIDCLHNEDVFLSCRLKGDELFTLVNRWGSEIKGEEELGLLLYRGGTVCNDNFDDTAADAICKTMNYSSAITWTIDGSDFDYLKDDYEITLDDVACSRAEWTSCSYDLLTYDCSHSEDVLLSCRTNAEEGCFTDYKSDTGWFPDSAIIKQTKYVSERECLARCQQFLNCKAAVLSPADWSYRECFIVSTSDVTWRSRWSTAFRENSCLDTSFSIADKNGKTGVSSGFLLYNGGTVCPEHFDRNAAIIICSLLGYENENDKVYYWRSDEMIGMYEKTLYNLYCSGESWETCTYSTGGTCYASDDIYLQCELAQKKKSLSPGYVVLIVAVVIAVVVGAIYFFHRHKQKSTSEHDDSGETIANAAAAVSAPPPPNPPNENIYETRLEEPAPALGTDNLPPPQYVYYDTTLEDVQVPSYEEVMANDHVYQKPT